MLLSIILIVLGVLLGAVISVLTDNKDIDLYTLKARINSLENQLYYVRTRNDGNHTALELAMYEEQLSYEEAEDKSEYLENGKVKVPSGEYSLEEAKLKLNKLKADKHDYCLDLSDEEQDLIIESRYSKNKSLKTLLKQNRKKLRRKK